MTTVATSTIGMYLTLTGARTGYWVIAADVALTALPKVAVLNYRNEPDGSTVWTDAAWADAEAIAGTVHTRTLKLLLAGPLGPTTGNPKVVPLGEWDTWVRVDTSTERVEVRAGVLVVG